MDLKTYVDSISIKINTITKELNKEILYKLKQLLTDNIYYIKERKKNQFLWTLEIFKGNTMYCTIQSGTNGSRYDNNTSYYNEISVYGLKSYNEDIDFNRLNLLNLIVNYLKYQNIQFELSELDICLDIENINVNQLFVIRSSLPEKNKIDPTQQKYDETYYVEKFNSDMRGYIYNKQQKEKDIRTFNIDKNICRFEVKIQNRFRQRKKYNNLNDFIHKQLGCYHIYFFYDFNQAINAKNIYKSSDLKNSYQLMKYTRGNAITFQFDINSVLDFLCQNVLL